MAYELDPAIKFGAGRYLQGEEVLEAAGGEIARFGRQAFILTGKRSFAAVEARLVPAMQSAGVSFIRENFAGHCCLADAQQFAAEAEKNSCDIIVAIGGGRVCDMAKVIADLTQRPLVTIPTSMATCASFTCMSVMYTPEGAYEDCRRYEREIDAVLVDEKVLAACPAHLAAAGILDAMAKRIEIQNGRPQMLLSENRIDLYTAFSTAEVSYRILCEIGPQAIADLQAHRITKAVKDVAFTNIALTGVIANTTRSFGQSALAHSVYDGVCTHFPEAAHRSLHGEIVGVALFTQLVYNRLDNEVPVLREFMRGLGMPLTMEELSIPATDENLATLENYLIATPDVEDTPESLALLHRAMEAMRHA